MNATQKQITRFCFLSFLAGAVGCNFDTTDQSIPSEQSGPTPDQTIEVMEQVGQAGGLDENDLTPLLETPEMVDHWSQSLAFLAAQADSTIDWNDPDQRAQFAQSLQFRSDFESTRSAAAGDGSNCQNNGGVCSCTNSGSCCAGLLSCFECGYDAFGHYSCQIVIRMRESCSSTPCILE